MSPSDQKNLLTLARQTIGQELGLNKDPDLGPFSNAKFQEKRGVFVTLEIEKNLRGCIGNIVPTYPLIEAVQKNAFAAAFEDPRFNPLSAEEFPKITIEISLLTVPKALAFSSPEDLCKKLRPKIDGVVLQKGWQSATFLPQVWEDLPDPETFLSHLSAKAGLPPDAWKEAEIEIYQVEKFKEES